MRAALSTIGKRVAPAVVASVSTASSHTLARDEHQLHWSGLLRRLLRLGEARVCA